MEDVTADDAPSEGPDEVAFEVPPLTDAELDDLAMRLGEAGIVAGWDEDDLLVVEAADADRTEDILEAVLNPDALPVAEDHDDRAIEAISTWFVVADTLAKDPTRVAPVVDLVAALDATEGVGTPFGLDEKYWLQVRTLVIRIRELVGDEAPADEIREHAALLRNVLRPVV
ncbi:MAG: hypothetical protein AAFZ07_18380 [Actinomycetota bacterium]